MSLFSAQANQYKKKVVWVQWRTADSLVSYLPWIDYSSCLSSIIIIHTQYMHYANTCTTCNFYSPRIHELKKLIANKFFFLLSRCLAVEILLSLPHTSNLSTIHFFFLFWILFLLYLIFLKRVFSSFSHFGLFMQMIT